MYTKTITFGEAFLLWPDGHKERVPEGSTHHELVKQLEKDPTFGERGKDYAEVRLYKFNEGFMYLAYLMNQDPRMLKTLQRDVTENPLVSKVEISIQSEPLLQVSRDEFLFAKSFRQIARLTLVGSRKNRVAALLRTPPNT